MITLTPLSVPYAPASLVSADAETSGAVAKTGAKGKGKAKGKAKAKSTAEEAGGVSLSLEDAEGGEEIECPKALAYLLELDDVKILIDCGGSEEFSFPRLRSAAQDASHADEDEDRIENTSAASHWQGVPAKHSLQSGSLDVLLSRLGPTIDLVLLSHSTISHLGSLPYARAHYGLTCPIFATLPTQTMGRLTVLEMVHALRNASDIDLEMRLAAEIDAESQEDKGDGTEEKEGEKDEASIEAVSASRAETSRSGPAGPQRGAEEGDAEAQQLRAAAEAALAAHLDPSGSKTTALKEQLLTAKTRRRIPTIEQVESCFESITTLRYLQPYHFGHGSLAGITLTAYNAGHSLGGAVWKLRSPSHGTMLIALDWNHNRERHLDSTALLASASAGSSAGGGAGVGSSPSDGMGRADLMITSIERATFTNIRRKDRDAAILDIVHSALQANRSVLFPIDPSARLLELLVLLDQHWAYAYKHVRFPLCLVSSTGAEVIERARTLMEWMTKEWATAAAGAANAKSQEEEREEANQGSRWNQRKLRDKMQKESPASPLDFK